MKYSEWSPTGFDIRGLGLDSRQDWLVAPEIRTRDSSVLAQCNFDAILESLGGESDTVEIHRFGHWACGWLEIILVDPIRERELDEIEGVLSDYPVLDEERYSLACYEETCQSWERMSISERIEILNRNNVSIFAARRDELPELPHWDDIWTDEG